MSPSVLGHLTLGYQLVWNRLRQIAAIQLFIDSTTEAPVDAEHLLRTLAQAWSGQSPHLILSVRSARLLADLLAHASPAGPWIAVPNGLLSDPEVVERVHQARQRGLPLVWRGDNAERDNPDTTADFARGMVYLTPDEVRLGMHAALHPGPDPASAAASPIQADQIYEGVPNRVLAEHCLDRRGAWGIAGWPSEDILQAYQHRVPPGQRSIVRLLAAIDADASLDVMEHILADEPVLAYRFLRHANSVAVNPRGGVDSLRHGLLVLGLANFRRWLVEQTPQATEDANLLPVRRAMVLRAQLMEHLLDAGDEDRLRHEIVLCGLLSRIDQVTGEPLTQALQHIPLSERVIEAIVDKRGPYTPYLELADALEGPGCTAVQALCEAHGIDIADVNRVLLRVLAQSQLYAARPR